MTGGRVRSWCPTPTILMFLDNGRFGGAAHNEEMKALWAFSPSGRWSPPLMASEMERGGVITCEYGEPPQTVGFIPAADPTASALTA